MRELIFDAILFILIIICFERITYTRHKLEMNITITQGLQYQIDELKEKLDK